ncbi:MAG: cytochrome c [Candidatus Sericytochromatia bacterium]|nr:cytochrome c [Candidatus Tanganyikabacteria bacterium]
MGRTRFALLAGACALAVTACVPPTLNASSNATLSPKAEGEKVYADCLACHGADGTKTGTDLKALSFTKMKEGLQKPAMAGVKDKMSDEKIAALMAYLATLSK